MTGAWVAIALVLVGLPLLGWFVSRRAMWNRLTPRAERDPYGATVRRHRLSVADVATVRRALRTGEELESARLRAAVVDWAHQELGPDRPRAPWWVHVLILVWLAVFLANTALLVAQGRWGEINWVAIVAGMGSALWLRRRRAALRRAARVNGGAPEDLVDRPDPR
ncbi:hypothetical protein [Modestobacter sp. NPDC049651]|uniref:hypothetical protein n=1 Tax=unclassified Modestobacter TaxID=2643866 RepID=UPI00340A2504